jgi:Ca2+-binding RTX toxin-like protein
VEIEIDGAKVISRKRILVLLTTLAIALPGNALLLPASPASAATTTIVNNIAMIDPNATALVSAGLIGDTVRFKAVGLTGPIRVKFSGSDTATATAVNGLADTYEVIVPPLTVTGTVTITDSSVPAKVVTSAAKFQIWKSRSEPYVMPTGHLNITYNDLQYILDQIKMGEAHAKRTATSLNNLSVGTSSTTVKYPYNVTGADRCFTEADLTSAGTTAFGATGLSGSYLWTAEDPLGVRTVNGECNNISSVMAEPSGSATPKAGDTAAWGSAEKTFTRLAPQANIPNSPLTLTDAQKLYESATASVIDPTPRIISNLISDQSMNNPAAIAAAYEASSVLYGVDSYATEISINSTTGDTATILSIPNITADYNVSAGYNSWFTLFGQFFDHGLDLVPKAGASVQIFLQQDDPLYVPVTGAPNMMVLTRASDASGQSTNETTPWIDQSQTYGSHASQNFFLREYTTSVSGTTLTAKSNGRLLESADAGMPTWKDIKAQALRLGILLTDYDAKSVPVIATDQYGKFIAGSNGYPLMLFSNGSGYKWMQGYAAGLPTVGAGTLVGWKAVSSGHAFINDTTASAVPYSASYCPTPNAQLTADLDLIINSALANPSCTYYDNETLDIHLVAGDGRINENIGLSAIHNVFHSEHNLLVQDIKDMLNNNPIIPAAFKNEFTNTTNGGERLYQAARFIMEMEYQHMAYDEFVRRIAPELPLFLSYDPSKNGAITAEFASAVYRLGHSMLNENIARSNPGEFYDPTNNQDVALIGAFTNPSQARLVRPAFIESASYSGGAITYTMSANEKAPLNGSIVTIANMANKSFDIKDGYVTNSGSGSFKISQNFKAGQADKSAIVAPTGTSAKSKTSDCSTAAPIVCTNYATVTISDPGSNPYSYTPAEAAASIAQGMSTQRGNEIDEFVTDAVRNNLLGLPLDLATLNITRGRDVGLPTLNQFRSLNTPKLAPYLTWADFVENGLRHTESGSNFIAAYGTHKSITDAITVADKRAAGIAITTAALVVNITDAVSNGTSITYTGFNTYTAGQTVNIYGITGPAASTCNISNATVIASDVASFTVSSAASCAGYRAANAQTPGSGGYAEFNSNGTAPLAVKPPDDAKDFYNSTGPKWNSSNTGLNNIDLWMGGLAEKPAKQPILAPMLGTTFQYIFTEQMQRLQDNDRFYYLTRLVGMNLFGEIPAQKFTDIVRRTTPSASSGNPTANRGIIGMNNPGFAISDCAASTNAALVQGIMTCAGMKTDSKGLLSHKGLDNVTIFAAPASALRAAIAGGDGDDSIQGGAGDDWLSGGPSGGDLIDGAAGNDIIIGGFGEDLLKGGAGNDVINAGSSQIGDIADGGSGSDFIHCGDCAGIAASFIGEAGDDFIQGGKGADLKLDGGEGDDWIEGGDGWDIIDGDNGPLLNILINLPVFYGGNDVITGGAGQDVMFGDGGDDIFNLGSGPGFPDGTYGFDWANYEYNIRYDNSTALRPNVWADLSGQLTNPNTARSNDVLVNIEGLSGSSGNDKLYGGTGTADITVTSTSPFLPLGRAGSITLTLPGVLNIAGGSVVTGVGIAPNVVVLALTGVVLGNFTTIQLSAPNIANVPGPIQISTAPLEVPSLITGLSELVTGTPGTVKYVATDPLSTKWSGGGIILGGDGNDTVYPSSGADILHGSAYLHTCIGVTKSPVPAQVLAATDVVCGGGRGFSTMSLLAPFMDNGVLNPGELKIVREILPTSARVTGLVATGTTATYTAKNHFFVGEEISIVGLSSTSAGSLAPYGTKSAVITSATSDTFTITSNAAALAQLSDLTAGIAVGTDTLDLSGGATLNVGTPGTVVGGGISGPSSQFTFTAITGTLPSGASFGCRMTDSVSGAVVVLYDFQKIKFTDGNVQNISTNCGGMDVPSTPAAPAATGGGRTASITWVAPAENGSPIDYYLVELSLRTGFFGSTVVNTFTGSCAGRIAANLRECNVTGLNAGNYQFKITAHNAVGLSAKSASSNQVTVTATTIKIRPTLSAFSIQAKVVGDPAFSLTPPTVGSAIPGNFTYSSANTSVISISNGDSATVGVGGTAVITALFTPSDLTTYETATITATATVNAVLTPPVVGGGGGGGGVGGLQIALTPTAQSYPAGSVVKLGVTGGTNARVLFSTNTSGCRIIGTDLTATSAETCAVTASQGAVTGSANVTFALSTQSPLRISNKTNTIKVGRTLILTTVGGTSSGAVSYSVSGPCTIASSDEITGNAAGDCVVIATKAGTAMYAPVTSTPFTFTVK